MLLQNKSFKSDSINTVLYSVILFERFYYFAKLRMVILLHTRRFTESRYTNFTINFKSLNSRHKGESYLTPHNKDIQPHFQSFSNL